MTQVYITKEDEKVFQRIPSSGNINHDLRRAMIQGFNRCSSCNCTVTDGRPIFAGYDANRNALIVCCKCSQKLEELATPVYTAGTLDLSVNENEPLWRYMDFAKFAAMLQQGGIYFAQAADFSDPFEAAAGLASRESEFNDHYLSFFRGAVVTPPQGYPSIKMKEDDVENEAVRLLKQLKAAYATARTSLVNCWHMNDVESEALWQIYCPPGAPGIAVRSSVHRLWKATENESNAIIGKVHYIDYKRQFASGDQRIFCKRSSLAHEREVRAVLRNDPRNPIKGRIVVCDLNELIDGVVVSPYAPSWFPKVIEHTISKFGYHMSLSTSEIADSPFL